MAEYGTPEGHNRYFPEYVCVTSTIPISEIQARLRQVGRLGRDEQYRILIHEQTHHLQYTGTTYGLFFNLCGLFVSRLLGQRLDSASDRQWSAIRSAFPVDGGLLQIDRNRTVTGYHTHDEPLDRDWWGSQVGLEYARHFLKDDSNLTRTRTSPATCFHNALAIASSFGPTIPRISIEPTHTDDAISPGRDLGRLVFGDDERSLTTDHLLEAAATANDFLLAGFALGRGVSEQDVFRYADAVSRRLFEQQFASHNLAFRLFLDTHPWAAEFLDRGKEERIRDVLMTFLVLTDLALNPPLPPIYETDWEAIGWISIHPPIRFALLVQASTDLPLLTPDADEGIVRQFMESVCARAELRSFALDAMDRSATAAAWKRSKMPDTFSLPESYLLRSFENLTALRQFRPHFPGAWGLFLRDDRWWQPFQQQTKLRRGHLLAPFDVDGEANLYSYMDEPVSSELLGAFAARALLRLLPVFGPNGAERRLLPLLRQKVADESVTGWVFIEDVLRRYVGVSF